MLLEPFKMQNNLSFSHSGLYQIKTNQQILNVFNSLYQELISINTNLNKNFNKIRSFSPIFL
ncbi:MAG: hypothetical protein A2X22_14455 [Bacteroidetes bacterium GWF2_49_14]|nr:MAG: hypothetical protein A2X22_14455 [Bacteroidetes bacterium GWF2_49_14]HBB91885.1 hypothetical protein [Bacteroidales bacterium]